jgi:hypothetical protein
MIGTVGLLLQAIDNLHRVDTCLERYVCRLYRAVDSLVQDVDGLYRVIDILVRVDGSLY